MENQYRHVAVFEGMEILHISPKTGAGIDDWTEYLLNRRADARPVSLEISGVST